MAGVVHRVWLVTATLVRQNRLLIILLLLWPFVLSAIVVATQQGTPAIEDVAAILEQELFYGLVLGGLSASVTLGTEQRAHRAQQVLGRAVSRTEYLVAIALSAFLPFAGYVLVWLINAKGFSTWLHQHPHNLFALTTAELVAGVLLITIGVFLSVLVPQLLAAGGTGVALAAMLAGGSSGKGGVSRLFTTILGSHASAGWPWPAEGEALLCAGFALALAAVIFDRRDLHLS